MALASTSSTIALTSTSCLIRYVKLFKWLDMMTSTDILNLNNRSFKENFAFTIFAVNP
jgi:hypothetical protein